MRVLPTPGRSGARRSFKGPARAIGYVRGILDALDGGGR
jgi:hypothetical protein